MYFVGEGFIDGGEEYLNCHVPHLAVHGKFY